MDFITAVLPPGDGFITSWNNPLLDSNDGAQDTQNEGAASQNRALLWGVLGLLGGFVLMYQLGWNVRRGETQETVRPAFEHDKWLQRDEHTTENE